MATKRLKKHRIKEKRREDCFDKMNRMNRMDRMVVRKEEREESLMDRTAIFVDVQNIYYTVKQKYDCHFDYSAFWEECTSGREVVKAIAYATDKGDRKQGHFQQILRRIGFEIKLTPFLQRSDGSAKGDWDVGISLDMVECAGDVDTIVLASGDGDYSLVVDKVMSEHNISVEIYGVPDLTAMSLIESATRFMPIEGKLLLTVPTTWGSV